MALAFDAYVGNDFGNTSSQTLSHTCTGSNRFLLVGIGHNGDSSDLVTGVTYNSVSMTRVGTDLATGSFRVYLYYLINPASGTHDVVVSMSAASFTKVAATSYTGALQSGQPDSSGSNHASAATTMTTSTTVVAANSWVVGFIGNDNNNALSASTGVNASRGQISNSYYFGDSNAGQSAGSYGMTWTCSAQKLACVVASISPDPTVARSTHLSLLGVS